MAQQQSLPSTVFQAWRSLFNFYGEKPENKQRNLEFIGPFLMDDRDRLWLPTPKDLIGIKESREDNEKKEEIEESLDKRSPDWNRLNRLRPKSQQQNWEYLIFPADSLEPMGPPQLNGEFVCCPPKPWIKATALCQYLEANTPYMEMTFAAILGQNRYCLTFTLKQGQDKCAIVMVILRKWRFV